MARSNVSSTASTASTASTVRAAPTPRKSAVAARIVAAATACPVAAALEVIGEKWTLLVLRDLSRHPARRFQDLIESLEGCAPNTLSARLSALEHHGLIERRLYEQHPPRMEYLLTGQGRDVLPVLAALKSWGTKLQVRAAAKTQRVFSRCRPASAPRSAS